MSQHVVPPRISPATFATLVLLLSSLVYLCNMGFQILLTRVPLIANFAIVPIDFRINGWFIGVNSVVVGLDGFVVGEGLLTQLTVNGSAGRMDIVHL